MFSSTNPFLQQYYFPSSSSSPPPPNPILHHETAAAAATGDILFQHDPLSSPFLLNIISPLLPHDAGVVNFGASRTCLESKQDTYANGDHQYVPKKPTPKKDRHSKIYTAQGLRDRRVRLSIEIAREFFDLQDLLGFDKASKTLEWLLTKSKKAIRDLARTKLSGSSSSLFAYTYKKSTVSECEEEDDIDDDEHRESVSKSKKGTKDKNTRALQHLRTAAKESRAKARARARERTKEKMKIHHHHPKRSPTGINQPSPRKSSSSIMIENNNTIFSPNLPQNWDINSPLIATTRPGFCANTNMNLSTGMYNIIM